MTSDAKIGLLLGLVFIFVIAFVINGLPNFGGRQNADAAPAMTFDDESLGLADQAQSAQEHLDWTALLEQNSADESAVLDELPAVAPESASVEPQTTVVADGEEIRSVHPLDSLMSGASRTFENVFRTLIDASEETVTMQQETTESVPTFDIPTPPPAETSPRVMPVRTAARRPVVRTYEVQDGDVLATVAKKAYGPEEGNRLVNIRRIYEANRTVLKSPDEIFVGQKLVIPPLPAAAGGADRPNPTLSGSMFERAESVGRRNLADIRPATSEGRWYVVQDGDNLWNIAAKQLGSGARCDEIAKMNSHVLKNKDMLDIGMRLRLPVN